jgi:LCP family protein required for cell wall assembly
VAAVRTPPRRPAPPSSGPVWPRIRRRLRIAAVVAAVLVVALDGVAWGLYRNVTGGITTTDVISGGGDGGNILLVGVDSRTDTHGNPLPQEVIDQLHGGPDTGVLNSDTIIVLHVPAGGGAAVAFSIPRDAYVDIPGYRTDKINAAYPATKALVEEQLVRDGAGDRREIDAVASAKGRQALIGAVEDLTGLTIDHYAEINLLGFSELTSAIGGVDVCLDAAVDEPLSGAHLPAGRQTLAGPAALSFVRQRHGLVQGDLSRIRRQQVFLASVAHKILSAGTLTDPAKLSALVTAVQNAVVVDSGWDLLGFAQRAGGLAGGNLAFLTIPTTGAETNDRGDVVTVDRRAVRDFVDTRVAEQEAAAEQARRQAARPTPQPFGIVPSRYVVDVRNGSSTAGLAGAVSTLTQGLGFLRGTVDNTAAAPESVVRWTGSDAGAAQELADRLGGIGTEQVDAGSASGVTPGHLLVVVGADFDPAVAPLPPKPAATPSATTTTAPAAPPPEITADGVPCVD